jgi:hypothetical protein
MGGTRRALLAGLITTGLLFAAPAAPAAEPDPTRPGRATVTVVEYDAGATVLAVAPANGAPVVADLHGELYVPGGRGPFPVVVLMHGRHATCAYAGAELLGHPCPRTPVTTPVDSFRGYAYLGRNLASHGYLVRVQLTDSTGRTAAVAARTPEPPPGTTTRNLLLSDVRVPLRRFAGLDVTALRSVRILLDGPATSLQLADVALHTA